METKKYAVVFDTNSYRNLVTGKTTSDVLKAVAEMRSTEAKKDIIAFGIQIVGLEMLGNLAEGQGGFNFNDCYNGLIAMSYHIFDDTKQDIRFIPHPYLHLTRSFFGTIPQTIEAKSLDIGGSIRDFKIDYSKALSFHTSNTNVESVKNYLDFEELTFSKLIEDLIDGVKQEILKKHPRIAKKQLRIKMLEYIENGPFEPLISIAIIYILASSLQLQIPKKESIKRAFTLNLEFPLSVGFFSWICFEIIDKNIDMQSKTSKEKRWNWIWDYQVSFLISNHSIDNREVIIVTADSDMTDMLTDFGYGNRVMKLNDYIAFLNS